MDDRAFTNELRRVELKAQAGLISANRQRGGFRNRVIANTVAAGLVPTPGAAGSTTNILAAMLPTKTSGIFAASFALGWTQAATGTYRYQVTTQTSASALGRIALSNATSIGTYSTGGLVLFGTLGVFSNNGVAAGITVTNPAGSLSQWDSGVQTMGTLGTAETIAWSGIVQNTVTPGSVEVPFPVNNFTLLLVTVITTTSAISAFNGASLSFYELP